MQLATLGTPTKDENGRLIQRWYPVEGDMRLEGLEVSLDGLSWTTVEQWSIGMRHVATTDRAYRIPSTYTPPSGWYCLPDDEMVKDGDCYSHDAGGGLHPEPREIFLLIDRTVLSSRRDMPNGGCNGTGRVAVPEKSDGAGGRSLPSDASGRDCK
jgi:hypothetical protein